MSDLPPTGRRTLRALRTRLAAALRARPSVSLAIGGSVAASVAVTAGGRIGTVKAVIPITNWLGLLSHNGFAMGDAVPGALMLTGIVVLIWLWLLALRLSRPGRGCSERAVWGIAGAWSLPFVLGPPLLSNDVYSYAAQGLMIRHGFDPYAYGPSVLGNVAAVAGVDPNWRNTPSPYGTVATTIEHLAVAISGGSPVGAVVVFRALAVVSVVAIGLLAAELAGARRVPALTLTILNPLVLLQIVSAAHFEGVMCALLLGALVAAGQRRWLLAIVLSCASTEVKVPALVAVLAIIAAHALGAPRSAALKIAARDSAAAALSLAGLSLILPDGLGWIGSLNTPALGHTGFAPASLLADLYAPIVRAASFDDLAAGGRITALVAAACAVGYLTVTADRRAVSQTAGFGLLAVGLLSPVLYPWYLLWAIVCLAPTARAARADWLILASALACVLTPPGFTRTVTISLTIAAIGVATLVMGRRVLGRRNRPAPAADLSAAG